MLPPVGWPGSSNPSGTITCTRSIFRPSRAPATPSQPPPYGRPEPSDRAFCTPPRRARSTRLPKPRVRVGPQVRGRLLSPRLLMAASPRSYTEVSRTAGPGSEECGSEEQLGPGEIGQFFLHGYAHRLPRPAHDPLIYGGERPHSCGSELC